MDACVSYWFESNEHKAVNADLVNAEKTIFRKVYPDSNFIIHGLSYVYVDGIKHIPTHPALMREFLEKYNKEFETTGGMDKLYDIFVGIEYEQTADGIKLHQDTYVRSLVLAS